MTLKQSFPYEKSIVTNALYDTIEKLELNLDSSNSARGTLIVSEGRFAGKMRIGLSTGASEQETAVSIFPEGAGEGTSAKWGRIILRELATTIEQAHRRQRR